MVSDESCAMLALGKMGAIIAASTATDSVTRGSRHLFTATNNNNRCGYRRSRDSMDYYDIDDILLQDEVRGIFLLKNEFLGQMGCLSLK
jgi:hypothetical protein